MDVLYSLFFFFSSRRRHTRWNCDWSSDVCSSDLLDFIGALEQSCDVYFYQVGSRLGLTPLEQAARGFGPGERTGVDLPQERRGLIPNVAWYERRWGPGRWQKGMMLNLAIGQGELLLTPLQLALVMAEVAEDGHPLHPHLVREVRGVAAFRPERPLQAGVVASPAVWRAVQRGLERA